MLPNNSIREGISLYKVFQRNYNLHNSVMAAVIQSAFTWFIFLNADFPRNALDALILCFAKHTSSFVYIINYLVLASLPLLSCLYFLKRSICKEYYYTRVSSRQNIALARIVAIAVATFIIEVCEVIPFLILILLQGACSMIAGSTLSLLRILAWLSIPRFIMSLLLCLWDAHGRNPMAFVLITFALILTEMLLSSKLKWLSWLNIFDISQINAAGFIFEIIIMFGIIAVLIREESKLDLLEGDIEKNE